MLTTAIYIFFIILEILLLGFLACYAVSMLFSWLQGAPYVPTDQKEIETILSNAQLKPHQQFLELGCGDGRVVRTAVARYNQQGRGVDINTTLIWWARIQAKLQNLSNITFVTEDVMKTDLSQVDVIYIFLFPKLVEKLHHTILHKTKDNILIIAHGFKIPFLEPYYLSTYQGKRFKTHYYQITR